jgi:hypothetical protein
VSKFAIWLEFSSSINLYFILIYGGIKSLVEIFAKVLIYIKH